MVVALQGQAKQVGFQRVLLTFGWSVCDVPTRNNIFIDDIPIFSNAP